MASTVIGAGITIEGEVTTDEDVVVHGTVRGKLNAKDGVTVEQGGVVEADITGGPLSGAGALTRNIPSFHRRGLQQRPQVIRNPEGRRLHTADSAPVNGNVAQCDSHA